MTKLLPRLIFREQRVAVGVGCRLIFVFFLSLFIWKAETEQTRRDLPSTASLPKCLQHLGLHRAKSRSQQLHTEPPVLLQEAPLAWGEASLLVPVVSHRELDVAQGCAQHRRPAPVRAPGLPPRDTRHLASRDAVCPWSREVLACKTRCPGVPLLPTLLHGLHTPAGGDIPCCGLGTQRKPTAKSAQPELNFKGRAVPPCSLCSCSFHLCCREVTRVPAAPARSAHGETSAARRACRPKATDQEFHTMPRPRVSGACCCRRLLLPGDSSNHWSSSLCPPPHTARCPPCPYPHRPLLALIKTNSLLMAWEGSGRCPSAWAPAPAWETREKLLAPGFGSAQLRPLRPFRE
nr:uncharacterized protein LOC127488079 [Oryctolagus cuniculus]